MEALVCCNLAQESQMQYPEHPRTTLCLKGKSKFRRNPRRTKLLIRACTTLVFPCMKKYTKRLNCSTFSDTSLNVLALGDVITGTASYRCCYHVFFCQRTGPGECESKAEVRSCRMHHFSAEIIFQ